MKSMILLLANFFITSILMAQDFALSRLEESPRHHEWVKVEHDGRTVHSFVAYPEVNKQTMSVLIIHENRGLTDWVRSFADQVAGAGYIAIAPDLLSGFSDEYERTSDFSSSDAARDALYTLDPDQITADLHAVRDYIASVPSSNGTVVVAGFCWGGSQTFRFATNSDQIAASMVFYGSAPTDAEDVERISAPVYGYYGENDQRINAGIPAIEELMNQYNKTYEYEIYKGAGHAFMRAGDDPEASAELKAAHDAAWKRLTDLLENISMM